MPLAFLSFCSIHIELIVIHEKAANNLLPPSYTGSTSEPSVPKITAEQTKVATKIAASTLIAAHHGVVTPFVLLFVRGTMVF
jgi:hypothetical protein